MNEEVAIREGIVSGDLDDFFSRFFCAGVPHIFEDDATLFRSWRATLASLLHVDPSEIILVGSAAIGFSLSPYKGLKPFAGSSDVDVAVISEHYFSEAWHHLRGIDLAMAQLTPAQKAVITEHRTRLIYWGCIATERILSILPFAVAWMTARTKMSREPPTEDREIRFRIYKDFRALRSYHLAGLRDLRAKLLE